MNEFMINGELTYRGEGRLDETRAKDVWIYDSMIFQEKDGAEVKVKNVEVMKDFPLELNTGLKGSFHFTNKRHLFAVENGGQAHYSRETVEFGVMGMIYFGVIIFFNFLIAGLLVFPMVTIPLTVAIASKGISNFRQMRRIMAQKVYLKEHELWDPEKFRVI